MKRGADILAGRLEAYGVKTIFALSGNQIMPVFDALIDTNIRLIHTRHEAAAVYMAEAHAQITGEVGVALVTAGAGLGNAAGALIAAQSSDTPVLLLSGDSPVAQDGRGAFQEMDQVGVTNSLTKGARRVMAADAMAEAVDWALTLAAEGRPGPVHLALPADALTGQGAFPPMPASAPQPEIPPLDLAPLYAAERPLILLGPALNATRAPGLAAALTETLGAPALVLESPRGLNDPSLGRLAEVARQSDCVLSLGKAVDFTLRFGDGAAWPSAENWLVGLGDPAQVEAARKNLGQRLASVALADPKRIAAALLEGSERGSHRGAWLATVAELTRARVHVDETQGISPTVLCAAVQRRIDQTEGAALICDGGEFGQWSQSLLSAPKQVLNGVSGIIGGGLCYAMGAKAADPSAQVFAMMGDGTVGFHLSEFETAARENLPFVAVIGNDMRWNAEHMIQKRSFGDDRLMGCGLSDARYDQAVEALGGFGAFVTQAGDLDDALAEAAASGRPACVNVRIEGRAAPNLP